MKFQPVSRRLKNGELVTIRECQPQDAEEFLQTAKTYIKDSEHVLITDENFNPTIDYEVKWIRSFMESENSLLLVATHNDKILGNLDLRGGQRTKIRHTAVIGMGMLKEWRNIGLGTLLMECVITWARENPVLEILWLQVFASNVAGVSLYKKMGFEISGRQKDFIKIQDETYTDNITMDLKVK
jgi:RimJ/RimL family protein N-acetyltransferase